MSDPNSDYLDALADGDDPSEAAARIFRGRRRPDEDEDDESLEGMHPLD